MIPKLWSSLMLKLTRLIVAIENAFHKKEPSEKKKSSKPECAPEIRRLIKSDCQSHDYCEQCGYYFITKCLFADDDEGIPCYWNLEEDDG